MLYTSGFEDEFMFSHNGLYGASRVFPSGRRIAAAETTASVLNTTEFLLSDEE